MNYSSKMKMYLNAFVAILTMFLSVIMLIQLLNIFLLICYLGLSTVITFLAYKFKLFLQSRIEENLSKNEQCRHKIQDGNKKQLLIIIGTMFLLILPLILVFLLEPVFWFLSFTSFVTGISLSEIIIYYLYVRDKK